LPLSIGFLCLAAIGIVTNESRVEIAPALVFLYGVLSPLAIYRSVQVLWPVGHARIVSRWIVGLGLVELAVAVLHDLPRFISSKNPDVVSGTFGTNPYQFVFFMVLLIALLAGIYSFERGRTAARLAPLMIAASLLFIVLAQYRALLLTIGLSLLLVTMILSWAPGKARNLVVAGIGIMAFMAAIAFGAQNFPILKLHETLNQKPAAVVERRLDALGAVGDLYSDDPRFALTGSGPGTFSSRGWQTFALSDSPSASNVQGGYAEKLTGGVYHTDVSDRYIQPLFQEDSNSLAGSLAANSPYSSYTSVAAETGLVGLLLFLVIYGSAFLQSLRLTLRAIGSSIPGDSLPALCLAVTVGFFVLLQMGLLENWLEVTRLTFIVWILFAIASKEFHGRIKPAVQ
jgi:hypothetical protein